MAKPQHVLFVGIDGTRWDVLQSAPRPSLDRVSGKGFIAPLRVNDAARTISGPGWASMFTGVLATAHNIFDNDLTKHRLAEFPDFLARVVAARPEVQKFVGADWQPLVTEHSGGPMIAGGGFVPEQRRGPDSTLEDWFLCDQEVVDEAVKAIRGFDSATGSVSYVYLHVVDTAGHRGGVNDRYREAVAGSDTRLGEVLDAVESRPTFADEDWLIIVATDHGHVDAGGHGGDDVHERTAWIAASGPQVPTTAPEVLEQADVAGHVLHVLDLVPDIPEFVGLPFGTRTAPAGS